MRRIATPNEFFDILDQIKGGQWVTIGAVVGANLNGYPSVKRKNPLTNRMKGYPDHEAFGVSEEISALVKISSYNMHYSNRDKVSQRYGEWKQQVNSIRRDYGAPEIQDRDGYKGLNDYGNGIEGYNGEKESLKGHSYAPQNIFNVKPKSLVYAINQEGHIIQALKPEQVKPYIKQYKEYNSNATSYRDSGANALMKMGVEEEKIKEYLQKIADLKFSYMNFEANSILWIAASVNGEKIVYINDNLSRAVDGININPQDFIAIAKERYQIDLSNLHEMRMRQLKVLAEMDWRTYDSAHEKAYKLSQRPNISKYEAERRKNQADAFRKYSNDMSDKQYGIDKIKQRERDHDTEVVLNKTKAPFKYTNGELKRLDKQSRDVHDYYDGKQHYKDGKWMNKESKNVNMNKDIYRLTESELKYIIKESAMKILSELDWRTYASAAQKNDVLRKENPNHKANQWNRSYYFRNAARDAFDKKHGLDHQFDEPNSRYGGDKGSINLNAMDDFSVTGSRDHDFGDGDPHGLRHNVYHMSKKYGKDGGYGRTRMWDTAHETTPEKFYGSNEMGKKFRDAEKDAEDFTSGKSHYVNGKGWTNESKINEWTFSPDQLDDKAYMDDYYGQRQKLMDDEWERKNIAIRKKYPGKSREWYEAMLDTFYENKENKKKALTEESFQNNQGYSHFAVNKATNKIVNGWDYADYDPNELRQFKNDYFTRDLIDYDLDPKQYKIVTGKYLLRQGIDPNDNNNWANS